jgi:zinc transport system substrate-binding protein
MSKHRLHVTGIVAVLFAFLSCDLVQAQDNARIYTTNYPLSYFAQRIAGKNADVRFPAPGDIDPVFWKPDTETIGGFQHADVILLNGAGYEKWTGFAFLPSSRMVDTSRSYTDRLINNDESPTHSHGPEGDHSHLGVAWTTWLDFDLAAQQAENVHKSLVDLMPGHTGSLDKNFKDLEIEIRELDKEMTDIAEGLRYRSMLASHPVYQYLGRRYGLYLTSLVWEPETDPGEEQWKLIGELVAREGFTKMLWEGQPLPKTVSRLEKLGVSVIVFDPAANVPESGDWLDAMKLNIERFRKNAL